MLPDATNQVYQRKADIRDFCVLFKLHTLPVCEVACNCLYGGEQHKFLSSPQPLTTCLTHSTRKPVQSQTNRLSWAIIWLLMYVPPLVQPRKSKNCMLVVRRQRTKPLLNRGHLYMFFFSSPLHFLVMLYVVIQEREYTRPLIVSDWHTWGLSFNSKQIPSPELFQHFTTCFQLPSSTLCFLS